MGAICKGAQIGHGRIGFSIVFPGSEEIRPSGKLLLFNGAKKGGIRTLYAYAFLNRPVPSTVVITGKAKKVDKGVLGTELVLSIPKIAGGAGSVTSLNMTIDRKYTYRDTRVSALTLRCPSRGIYTTYAAVFGDGHSESAKLLKPCIETR
jgi:hypothetical protein